VCTESWQPHRSAPDAATCMIANGRRAIPKLSTWSCNAHVVRLDTRPSAVALFSFFLDASGGIYPADENEDCLVFSPRRKSYRSFCGSAVPSSASCTDRSDASHTFTTSKTITVA
jgi:hypothetical protein